MTDKINARLDDIEARLSALEGHRTAPERVAEGGRIVVKIERITQRTTKAGQPMATARVERAQAGSPKYFDVVALGEDAAALAALGEGWTGSLALSGIREERWTGADGQERKSYRCFLDEAPEELIEQQPSADAIDDDSIPF